MNWDFTAGTPEELAQGIRPALLKGKHKETVANEKQQMVHLLESLALTSLLQYPVRVRHTSNKVPDYQLAVGSRRIAIELTKIKFQDLQCGRALQISEAVQRGQALQKSGFKGTLWVSRLYPKQGRPRKPPEIIKDGGGMPAMLFSPSLDEENHIWLEQARERLDTKTAVLTRKDFAHGDEDWLALVDTVGELPEEAQNRGDSFSQLLAGFWGPEWFSRVFLQDNYFRWQMMFTAQEFIALPGHGA